MKAFTFSANSTGLFRTKPVIVPSRSLFSISLTYRVPLEIVEKHLESHRQFLKENYAKGIFIASGPKIPRTGGMILASLPSRKQLDDVLHADPFYQHQIAKYEVTEFNPTLYNKEFENIALKDISVGSAINN